jgi:hypothetical protein
LVSDARLASHRTAIANGFYPPAQYDQLESQGTSEYERFGLKEQDSNSFRDGPSVSSDDYEEHIQAGGFDLSPQSTTQDTHNLKKMQESTKHYRSINTIKEVADKRDLKEIKVS